MQLSIQLARHCDKLVEFVAKADWKAAADAYKNLHEAFLTQVRAGEPSKGLKSQIFNYIVEKVADFVYRRGLHTPARLFGVESFFHGAIISGDVNRVSDILKTLARCINEFNKQGEHAYFFCDGRPFPSLKTFLNNYHIDLNYNNQTALAFADSRLWKAYGEGTEKNVFKIMKLLCDNGADINSPSILYRVVKEALPFLLKELKADPNRWCAYHSGIQELPIAVYARDGSQASVQILIEHGSHYKQVDTLGNSVLHLVISRMRYISPSNVLEAINLVKYLVQHDPDLLVTKNKQGLLPLEEAVMQTDTSGFFSPLEISRDKPDFFALLLNLHAAHKKTELEESTKQRVMTLLVFKLTRIYRVKQTHPELSDIFTGWKNCFLQIIQLWGQPVLSQALATQVQQRNNHVLRNEGLATEIQRAQRIFQEKNGFLGERNPLMVANNPSSNSQFPIMDIVTDYTGVYTRAYGEEGWQAVASETTETKRVVPGQQNGVPESKGNLDASVRAFADRAQTTSDPPVIVRGLDEEKEEEEIPVAVSAPQNATIQLTH